METDYTVEFNDRNLKILVPKNAEEAIRVLQSQLDQRTGRFEVVVNINSTANEDQNIILKGKAFAIIPMPVPNKHIGAGQLINKKDIIRHFFCQPFILYGFCLYFNFWAVPSL